MQLHDRPDALEAATAHALLAALVAEDSVNPPGHTEGPVRVALAALADLDPQVLAADPRKPNVVVQLRNGAGRHVHLNAHLDTVPPGDLAAWSVEPFALTARDDRLFGLGTGNMKAAAAAMILAVRRLDAARARWRGTVTLSLVADECVFGLDGAAHLLGARPDLRGDVLVCGEGPGGMNLAVAEKGLMWVRLRARGRVGQGMLTEAGGSAPARLAAALGVIDGWNALTATPPLPSLNHDANREGMRVSANVGALAGGSGGFSQAVAAAEVTLDLRLPPGITRVAMAERLDALCAGEGLSWEAVKGWDANWSDADSAPAQAVRAVAARVRGRTPLDVTRLPASDAARWRRLGVPAVCFGPQPDLASGVDDHVLAGDLTDCVAIYAGATAHLAQTAV